MILQKLFKETLPYSPLKGGSPKSRERRLALSLGLALSLLTSCGNNGCEQTRESYFYASFKQTGRLSLSKIEVYALLGEQDSLMSETTSPKAFELNLKPDSTLTRVHLHCIVNDNGDLWPFDDTLAVRYTSFPYYLDMECGCSIYYNIEDVTVTNNLFKALSVTNKEITNEENVNIILSY